MDKNEIKQLLIQIKVFYSRFEAVEKDGGRFGVMSQTIDAWHRQIGWMEYDQAIKILDDYASSENGSKTPGVSLWAHGGKIRQSAAWSDAFLDQLHGVIRWKPEKDGDVFERKVVGVRAGCYEDEDGYLWTVPGRD